MFLPIVHTHLPVYVIFATYPNIHHIVILKITASTISRKFRQLCDRTWSLCLSKQSDE